MVNISYLSFPSSSPKIREISLPKGPLIDLLNTGQVTLENGRKGICIYRDFVGWNQYDLWICKGEYSRSKC